MNVNGVGNGVGQTSGLQAQMRVNEKAKKSVQAESGGENAAPGAAEIPQQEENAKGVIRLLQEGHFKGVADVRLRINFNDELQAIEHESLAQAAGEQVPALQDAVNSPIQALLDSGELDEKQTATVLEAQETFNASVQQAADDFAATGGTDTNSLKDGLRMAFETLADSLSPLVTALTQSEEGVLSENAGPPIEPTATEGGEGATTLLSASGATAVAASGTAEGAASPLAVTLAGETSVSLGEATAAGGEQTSILSTFMDDLSGAFNTALDKLDSALESASTMPELSPPAGNGKAYDKFVAMYNELGGVSPAGQTAEEPQGLNTVA